MRCLLFVALWVLLCATASFGQNTTALAPQALPGLNVQVRGGTILLANSSIGISNTTVALSNNTTNYVFLSSAGAVQTNTTGFTSTMLPIATVITAQGQIVLIQDNRPDYIFAGGGSGLPAGPTSPNGVPETGTSTPTAGVAGPFTYSLPGLVTRAVTGTGNTDTILATDCNPKRVAYQGAPTGGNMAVTLPTATTLAVPNCVLKIANNQTAGTVTITPTTWNFVTTNGGTSATLVLQPGQWVTTEPDPNGTSWDEDINPAGCAFAGCTWYPYYGGVPLSTGGPTSSTLVAVANQPFLAAFSLSSPQQITKVTWDEVATAVASTGDIGIYGNCGTTCTLLGHTGSFATTAGGVFTTSFASVTSLPIGNYYLATCDSSATPSAVVGNISSFLNVSAAAGLAHTFGPDATDTCTAGVLPNTITVANITNGTSLVPIALLASN